MSPAKRKSAKSGRAATVAARGGKARGKPRGSALTKAVKVKVKGKTPAGRGDHRLKAQTGSKAGARNGAGVACDMPREELELLLDRDEGRADVLSHVPACHPCTTSLTVIASQRDAIRHLTAEPTGTAVEYLLERGARAGERRLADLVYELAKACLVVLKNVDRRVIIERRPRDSATVEQDLNGVTARIASHSDARGVVRLTLQTTPESSALAGAESCVRILNALEGASDRFHLATAVLLVSSNRAKEAEKVLKRLIQVTPNAATRLHAYHNLLWALNDQGKHREVLKVGDVALGEYPSDWMIAFNLAVGASYLHDRQRVQRYSRLISLNGEMQGANPRFAAQLLEFEAPRFADVLGVDQALVESDFGIGHAYKASAHEAD